MTAEPILKTEKVCKWYNLGRNNEIRAVQEISLEIMGNDSMILYGPSGSGKTSLLGLMATIDRPTSGKITLLGQDVTLFSDAELSRVRRETIGFIFQSFNLFSGMPAWENVAYPLIPIGLRAKERYDRAAVLLERLGLGDRLHHSPEELSGGEQQRIAIARALINNPEILFADEPTSNIDAESVKQLFAILADLKREGKTIIVATHDPALREHGNVVVNIDRGQVTGINRRDQPVSEHT